MADFVRDVPRANVLTLRWIMRDARPGEDRDGPELDVTTTIQDAVPLVAATDGTVRAVENGRTVGVVDRESVLHAMADVSARDGSGSRRLSAPAFAAPTSRWRGSPAMVGGIVLLILVGFVLMRTSSPGRRR